MLHLDKFPHDLVQKEKENTKERISDDLFKLLNVHDELLLFLVVYLPHDMLIKIR